jgi:hypothetical protein
MFMSLAVLPLATHLAVTVADNVPALNVRPSCEAAAKAASSLRKDVQSCLDSESRARDELAKQWREFASTDRDRCLQESRLGGEPSYSELVTCLEMARDVKRLPEHNEALMSGTPQNGSSDRRRRRE